MKAYIRGQILHFFSDPKKTSVKSHEWIEDGLLILEQGKIVTMGAWNLLKEQIPASTHITHYQDGLIVPGFIDTHIHYPQLDMMAANSGGSLFNWLKTYAFPFEKKFADKVYAQEVADFFVNELLRNGTTTALVFSTTHPHATDAIFSAAEKKHMRLIAGKVVTDQNIDEHFIETPQKAYEDSLALIKKWHNKPDSRLSYALTIRFVPSTSPALFKKMQQLKKEYPDVYVHTHISENTDDVMWVQELYHREHYLAVYDEYDLLGHNTVLAHGTCLTDPEFSRLAETKSGLAFCPTSNLFLGSGLFKLNKAYSHHVKVGLGTDVGAGTSFSMLQTLNEAYKIQQLQKTNFSALEGFYLATLGGAKTLNLSDKLGNFLPGKEADFTVLNIKGATPLLQRRLSFAQTLDEKLFVLMMLGDDRSIISTYVMGELVYEHS